MERAAAERVIDGRQMEPPEPFVQTMAALDELEAGQTLLLRLRREPFPLYQALERMGFAWKAEVAAGGDVDVRIWQATDRKEN